MGVCVYDHNCCCPRGYDACENVSVCCDYCSTYVKWLSDNAYLRKTDEPEGVEFKYEPKKDELLEFARILVNKLDCNKEHYLISYLRFGESALEKIEGILSEYLKLKEANT